MDALLGFAYVNLANKVEEDNLKDHNIKRVKGEEKTFSTTPTIYVLYDDLEYEHAM